MSDPGRLLFVNENLGGHASLHLYLREAIARDAPALLATFHDVAPPRGWERFVGAPVPGLAELDLDLQPLRAQLLRSRHVRELLERERDRFDVAHVYTQSVALLSADLLAAMPSIVSTDCTTAQGLYHLPYRRPTRFTALAVAAVQRFERGVYEAATTVVAQSAWAARSMREAYGVPQAKLRVIPFGLTVGDVPARERPEGLPEVTFVGMTLDRKGGHRLVRAWREHLRDRCVLNLVTREPVAEEPGLRVHGDFVPGDPRLSQLLARTAVFAFPTEMDNSPYVVLEAMHAGVPVVSTRVGGIPEMVVEGETGLLVSHEDAAVAAGIAALLDDPGTAEAMGAAGRERVLERFDARRTTAALLEVAAETREVHAPARAAA